MSGEGAPAAQRLPPVLRFVMCAAACVLLASCSINRLAVRTVAGFLSESGSNEVFTGEDDPELVRDALPFVLKTYESLLAEDPGNADLCLATGRTFVMYAFAFIQSPADMLPVEEVEQQLAMRARAKKLFLRGREYILRGMEIRRPGFRAALDGDGAEAALRLAKKDDVDYLYWAGSSWMAAFSADPFDMDLIVTLPRAVSLLQQVRSWDPSYQEGAVEEILITFYGSAPADLGGSVEKARESFRRAVELSKGTKAGPYVALASSVSVKTQNAAEFRDLLGKALALDLEAGPSHRLENIISQRKARWMIENIDSYFLEEGP